jgi:hypothetical protein
MNLFRRFLTGATLITALAPMASAITIISYGFDSSTGNYTVTQTNTLGTTTLNVSSPTSLFSFGSFNSLGIAGATYAAGDSTFDYEFVNTVTAFQITNNDTTTSSDMVSASVQSLVNVDTGTNMPGPSTGGDRKNTGIGLGFGFTGSTPNQQTLTALGTPGYVAIASGATYTYPTLPATTTVGIGYANCATFGDTSATDGCSLNLNNSAYVTTGFSYGLTDNQQFADSLTGGGLLNLTIVATTTYSAQAEVTYEYTVPSGTPEPGTMVLLGSALVGLGVIRKRSRRA